MIIFNSAWKRLEQEIFYIYFILQTIFDFVQKINAKYDLSFIQFHRYLKVVFLSTMFLSFLRTGSIYNYRSRYIYALLIIFILSFDYSLGRIEYLMQYSFLFFSFFYIQYLKEDSLRKIYDFFKILIGCNFFFIVIGVLFDIDVFKTYNSRFGYNGIFITSMQTTIFYLSSFALSYHYKDYFFMIIALFSVLLIGTKTLYFGLPIYVIIDMFFLKRNRNIVIMLLLIFPCILAAILLFNSSLFQEILTNESWITAFFSYRDVLLIRTYNLVKETGYSFHSFLVGTFDLTTYKTEFDFIDILLSFGVLGILLFSSLFYRLYLLYCVSVESKAFFYVIILAILFSGNIITYPVNSFVFLVTLRILYDNKPSTPVKHTY